MSHSAATISSFFTESKGSTVSWRGTKEQPPTIAVLTGGSRSNLTKVPAAFQPPIDLYSYESNPLLSKGITIQGDFVLSRFIQATRRAEVNPDASLTRLDRMLLTVQHLRDIDEFLLTYKRAALPDKPCTRASGKEVGLMKTMCS